MLELQEAAEVADRIAGRVALAIERGSGWQSSPRLVSVCCNTLDALLGESCRELGAVTTVCSLHRLGGACLLIVLLCWMHDCAPCASGLALLQFEQYHKAKRMPPEETQEALLVLEVRHLCHADLTGPKSSYTLLMGSPSALACSPQIPRRDVRRWQPCWRPPAATSGLKLWAP
jgi:hypothetical protein